MRITDITLYQVVVPTKPDAVNSPEFGPAGWDTAPKTLIRIQTDEGIEGYGETYRETTLEQTIAGGRRLLGADPLSFSLPYLPIGPEPEILQKESHYPTRVDEMALPRHSSYDGYEIAIFDLVGKALGRPLHQVLGGKHWDRVPVDYWTGRRTPQDLARKAEEGKRRGFHGIKIKTTSNDPVVDGVKLVERTCGPDFKMTIDPNERFYRASEAMRIIRQLEECENIQVIESPVPHYNVGWYKLLRTKTRHPIAQHIYAGNPLPFQHLLRLIQENAVDYMNLNHSMWHFVQMAHMCDAAGIRVWHGSGCDLGIMDMSYIQASSVARNCTLPGDPVGHFVRVDDLVIEEIEIRDGYAIVPDRPGLGVTLDLEAVARYAVRQPVSLAAQA